MSKDSVKYYVVAFGKNEENFIKATLESMVNQTLKPQGIIFVDDNSSDDTRQIVQKIDLVTVIDSGLTDKNHLESGELGKISAKGIRYALKYDFDYLMLLGADDVCQLDYMERIIPYMKRDGVCLASGWDTTRTKDIEAAQKLIGTGIVVEKSIVDKMNLDDYGKAGYETYVMTLVRMLGYKHQVYDVNFFPQRKVGTNYNHKLYIIEGKIIRAFGHSPIFALLMMCNRTKNPLKIFYGICGYCSRNIQYQDTKIQKFVRDAEWSDLCKFLKKKLN